MRADILEYLLILSREETNVQLFPVCQASVLDYLNPGEKDSQAWLQADIAVEREFFTLKRPSYITALSFIGPPLVNESGSSTWQLHLQESETTHSLPSFVLISLAAIDAVSQMFLHPTALVLFQWWWCLQYVRSCLSASEVFLLASTNAEYFKPLGGENLSKRPKRSE